MRYSNDCRTRRRFVLSVTAVLAEPTVLRAQTDTTAPARRNASAFRLHEWQDHFDALQKGTIIADTNTRVLQYWAADGEMRVYQTSVPQTDELMRRG